MVLRVLEPLFDNEFRNTNFFNGRLLSAEDLRTEQETNREQRRRLGKAVGYGIVSGLEVSSLALPSDGASDEGARISVASGIAINRNGQVLNLCEKQTIALVPIEDRLSARAGHFRQCEQRRITDWWTGYGVYILVLSPVSGFSADMAPISNPSKSNTFDAACVSRYTVEGVQFWLKKIDISGIPEINEQIGQIQSPDQIPYKLRNHLAHLCLGTQVMEDLYKNPFEQPNSGLNYQKYGLLDAPRRYGLSDTPPRLTDCDIPLALIFWPRTGRGFSDMWSVRRRLVTPSISSLMPPMVSDKRASEGEAAFFQFQDQLHEIQSSQNQIPLIRNIRAIDYFRYLPAAGFFPADDNGVSEFFSEIPHRGPEIIDGALHNPPEIINGALLRPIIRNSFDYPPINLAEENIELVWIYRTSQSMEGSGESGVVPYVVFTTGHMPHMSGARLARFDLVDWNYGAFI